MLKTHFRHIEIPEWANQKASEIGEAGGDRWSDGRICGTRLKGDAAILRKLSDYFMDRGNHATDLISDEWIANVHVNEDELKETPQYYLKLYPSLPEKLPSRVVELLEVFEWRHRYRLNVEQALMDEFSVNVTKRFGYNEVLKGEDPLPGMDRVLNCPSITATTYDDLYSDFDETVSRLGLETEYRTSLSEWAYPEHRSEFQPEVPGIIEQRLRKELTEKYGWYGSARYGVTNEVIFPAFVDMISRGWSPVTLSRRIFY